MHTFIVDTDNNVTAYTTPEEAAKADASLPRFSSATELSKLAAGWPADRLIEVWNGIPGNSKATKLGPAKKAAVRIWKALQPLAAASGAPKPPKASKTAKPAKAAKAAKPAGKKAARKSAGKGGKKAGVSKGTKKAATRKPKGQPREGSKKAGIIALLNRAKGVSLPEVQELAGWQKHTGRGFISILGSEGGHKIESEKNAAGERVYRIVK